MRDAAQAAELAPALGVEVFVGDLDCGDEQVGAGEWDGDHVLLTPMHPNMAERELRLLDGHSTRALGASSMSPGLSILTVTPCSLRTRRSLLP